MELASMALWVLFLLAAFTQDSLSASNNTSTPGPLETSTTVTSITAALTVSDTTRRRTDVTSKAASSLMPQSTETTRSTTKSNYSTTNGGNMTSPGSMTSPTGSKEPLTSQTAVSVNGTTQAGQISPEPAFSTKPGLVVVICLFVLVLVIGAVVVLIKCCRRKEPAFKKLDEVPMAKVAEDSPFARYPPK